MSAGPPWVPGYVHQANRVHFANAAAALGVRLLEWDELNSVLKRACQAPPLWQGDLCGDVDRCASCKLQADEQNSNPLKASQDTFKGIHNALLAFDQQTAPSPLSVRLSKIPSRTSLWLMPRGSFPRRSRPTSKTGDI